MHKYLYTAVGVARIYLLLFRISRLLTLGWGNMILCASTYHVSTYIGLGIDEPMESVYGKTARAMSVPLIKSFNYKVASIFPCISNYVPKYN